MEVRALPGTPGDQRGRRRTYDNRTLMRTQQPAHLNKRIDAKENQQTMAGARIPAAQDGRCLRRAEESPGRTERGRGLCKGASTVHTGAHYGREQQRPMPLSHVERRSEKGNPPCGNLRHNPCPSGHERNELAKPRRGRWLAETVGRESSYRGDEVAGPTGRDRCHLKQNPAYSRRRDPAPGRRLRSRSRSSGGRAPH